MAFLHPVTVRRTVVELISTGISNLQACQIQICEIILLNQKISILLDIFPVFHHENTAPQRLIVSGL